MSSIIRTVLVAAAVALGTAGCATIEEPDQTDFLSDYGTLQEAEDGLMFYSAGKTGDYERFILDPVAMLYVSPEEDPPFTQEQLDDLKAHFDREIEEQLTKDDGYEIVTSPGPGVARIRAAITDIDKTHGELNVLIYTKVTGAGIGGVSVEGEMVDSVSGEQLAAMIRWGGGSRVLRAGFSDTGDAKLAIDRWTKDLRKRIDAVHGR